MYLDVSLPVAIRHATGIDGGAANVPEAKDGAGRQDQHLQLLRTLQKVNHLQKKIFLKEVLPLVIMFNIPPGVRWSPPVAGAR
jgi:hypothetical protein